MTLSLLALAAMAASHNVQVPHGNGSIDAQYHARTIVAAKTVGAATPNRFNMQRCRWTATIVVERSLAGRPALTRTLPGERKISGSLPGACTKDRAAVQQEVARRDDAIRTHLLAAAEQDRSSLRAELDAMRNLASS